MIHCVLFSTISPQLPYLPIIDRQTYLNNHLEEKQSGSHKNCIFCKSVSEAASDSSSIFSTAPTKPVLSSIILRYSPNVTSSYFQNQYLTVDLPQIVFLYLKHYLVFYKLLARRILTNDRNKLIKHHQKESID